MIDPADFNRVMNQLRVKLTGASDAGVKAEMYDVLHTFFKDSSSWLEALTVITVQDQLDYDIAPAEDGQIIRLAGIVDANGLPVPALMPTVGTISLRDKPNAGQTITVTVIKTVELPNDNNMIPIAPDWVLKQYPGTIMAGILGNMQSQSNASWTDAKGAVKNSAIFRAGIAEARRDALHRNTIGAQAWSFPQSFRTRNQRGGVSTGNDQRF